MPNKTRTLLILCILNATLSAHISAQGASPEASAPKGNTGAFVKQVENVSAPANQPADNAKASVLVESKNETPGVPIFKAPENANKIDESADMQGPFYFHEERLDSILSVLEMLLGKSIIREAKIPKETKLTFISKKQLTRDESIKALSALLAINGVAIIPIDDKFVKAVNSAKVSKQIPEFLEASALTLAPSQTFYTKLFELEHILVDEFQAKLSSSMTDAASSIDVFPKSNAFLVTDTLMNLQRIEALVVKLDASNRQMRFFQVKHASASDIKSRIAALGSDMFKDVKTEVDARTNKIIAIGPKSAMPQLEEIIRELDIESDPILKSEVIYIRHGEAPKLVTVLKEIVSGQQKKNQQQTQNQQQFRKNLQAQTAAETPKTADAPTAPKREAPQIQAPQAPTPGVEQNEFSGIEFSQHIQIVADERSNAIVVYGTPSDLRQISNIVEKLDIVLMQVRIDVIITEVSLSDTQVSGLSTFGISYNAGTTTGFSGNTQTFKLSDTGSPAFSITATEDSFSAIFDLASQSQNVKVLSSPTIVTTHNKIAEINVSQSLPVITSSMADISSATTTRSSVSYKDIGIQLIVTPLVGKDGNIQLEVDQSVDSVSGYTTIDGNEQPTISKRRAKSFISAANNEVIVLAGLQQTDTMQLDGGVWLLSDIPLIGGFFKPSKNESKRRELIIFLRPTVIKSQAAEEAIAKKDINKSLAKPELQNFLEKDSFYPNRELEDRASEFDRNRPYKKLVADPVKFMTGESRGPAPREETQNDATEETQSQQTTQTNPQTEPETESPKQRRTVIPPRRK